LNPSFVQLFAKTVRTVIHNKTAESDEIGKQSNSLKMRRLCDIRGPARQISAYY
jgi:hypothetical protein